MKNRKGQVEQALEEPEPCLGAWWREGERADAAEIRGVVPAPLSAASAIISAAASNRTKTPETNYSQAKRGAELEAHHRDAAIGEGEGREVKAVGVQRGGDGDGD